MKNNIKLNNEVSMDIPKLLESRMVILANSGGGKSWSIRKIAEEAVDQVQTIIIDPEGEFSSLREKYDFILAGKGADVPVETRSAALLAIKLLELGKSAVIDLYELHPQERQRYVKLFFDAMVNCPKELYHPVIVILDEAHEYAPEGKPSEATWAVEALASKGRKRGQCLIPASQRIAKLSKNLSAECNNKLIGRASQDIDMKRAGDELGFSKEKLVQLRQLKPGEFFAFGPAISDEVVKLKIGNVKTKHEKVGYKGSNKVPPPSHVIAKVLAELIDLPKEAEKEAKTIAEFKAEIKQLKTKLTQVKADPNTLHRAIEGAVQNAVKDTEKRMNVEFMAERDEFIKHINTMFKVITEVGKVVKDIKMPDLKYRASQTKKYKEIMDPIPFKQVKVETKVSAPASVEILGGEKTIGKCSRSIYSYLVMRQGSGMSKTQVAVATGYSQNSGGFNNSISELSAMGLLTRGHRLLNLNGPVQQELLIDVDISLEKWLPKLGACSRKIWALLLEDQTHDTRGDWSKEDVATETGYSVTSGGFNNSISELSALGLIERIPGGIKINPEILEL